MLEELKETLENEGCQLYGRSLRQHEGRAFILAKDPRGEKFLYIRGETLPEGFDCQEAYGGWRCPLSPGNAFALQRIFPWLRPRPLRVNRLSFGFGDRLGLATPGHVRALTSLGRAVFPVLAQQSIRELDRTGRTPEEVLASAVWGAFQEGYTAGFGADADHLKTLDDLKRMIPLGFTLYTCDPSDHVNDRASAMPPAELERAFKALPEQEKVRRRYLDKEFELRDPESGEVLRIKLDKERLARAAVKYLPAIQWAIQMYRTLKEELGEFNFELSVDETETPTTPEEHFFIVSELREAGVRLDGLAPRFVGEFQKAIDYLGDLSAFEEQLRAHAALARALGPYKLSVHSGSDKFRIYPLLRKHLGELLHIKTAGTSYLEALRTLALEEPGLFREIYGFALTRYDEDRKTYHVKERLQLPEIEAIPDERLAELLQQDDVRQLLHVTYGSVLMRYRERLISALEEREERYYELLEEHFRRHLEPLREV